MGQDLFERGPVSRSVLEASKDEIFAAGRGPRCGPSVSDEADGGADDLVVLFEGNVPADHVVEEDAQRPDGGWTAVVPPLADPFRRRVDAST